MSFAANSRMSALSGTVVSQGIEMPPGSCKCGAPAKEASAECPGAAPRVAGSSPMLAAAFGNVPDGNLQCVLAWARKGWDGRRARF